MSPLMIMSWYSPGKDTLTQAHIVSLDPCRIRSCLEQSWLRLGTQPELLQHVSGERERANRPNWWKKHTGSPPPYKHTQFKAFAWCTDFALAFPACQWRCTEKSAFTTSSLLLSIISTIGLYTVVRKAFGGLTAYFFSLAGLGLLYFPLSELIIWPDQVLPLKT